MANVHRAVGEAPYKTVQYRTVASTQFEIGDICYLETGLVKPASSLVLLASLALDQEAIHDGFVGVSNQAKLATDATQRALVFVTTGVFEYPLRTALAADKEIGTLFGVDRNSGATAILDQSLVEVATENLALGRLVERALSGATKVKIEIVSTKVLGGPQAVA